MLLKVKEGDGEGQGTSYGNIQVVYYPQCTLFHQTIEGDDIIVTYHGTSEGGGDNGAEDSALRVPLEPSLEGLTTVPVDVFNSPADVYRMGEPYDAWFSTRFRYPVILVYIGDSRRPVLAHLPSDKRGPKNDEPAQQQGWLSTLASFVLGSGQKQEDDNRFLTFNEAAPYLVTSRASLRDLNKRLPDGENADMVVMRPNIVVDDSNPTPSPGENDHKSSGERLEAWEEDYWGELKISRSGDEAGDGDDNHSPHLVLTANCGRCQSLNIDYATGRPAEGERGKVLKKLMADRRVDQGNKYSPIFGRYAFLKLPSGGDSANVDDVGLEVAVGDEVVVTSRNKERDFWNWPKTPTKTAKA